MADRPVSHPKFAGLARSASPPAGARIRKKKKVLATLVDAVRSMALDGEFDPPPSPQCAGHGRRRLSWRLKHLSSKPSAAPEERWPSARCAGKMRP